MHGSLDLPPGFALTTLVLLPKSVSEVSVVQFICDAEPTRLLTLTGTLPKIMSLTVNDRLYHLAWGMAVSQKRCFVLGRQLADDVYEEECAMLSFSASRWRSEAAIFYGFETAFPALSHHWRFVALGLLGVSGGVLRLLRQLYSVCRSRLIFVGLSGRSRRAGSNRVAP